MSNEYEINELAKEESWRMFRIIGELVEGFDTLTGIEPAVTFYGSARLKEGDQLYAQTEEIAYQLGQLGFSIVTGGGPGAATRYVGLHIWRVVFPKTDYGYGSAMSLLTLYFTIVLCWLLFIAISESTRTSRSE